MVHHWLHSETVVIADSIEHAEHEAKLAVNVALLATTSQLMREDLYIYGPSVSWADFNALQSDFTKNTAAGNSVAVFVEELEEKNDE